jgi:predicted Zn finger-like uncharacterized protein
MLIVCPTCATAYQVKLGALGAAGRSVRCAQCKNTWFATAESAVEQFAMAAVPAPSREPESVAPPAGDFETAASDFPVEGVMPPEAAAGHSKNALTVTDAPPLAPQEQGEAATDASAPKFDPGVPDPVETITARRARQTYADRKDRRSLLQRLFSLPMLIVALLAVVLGALQWRAAVVRQFPQTASLYSIIGLPVNLRGLTFEDVKSTGEFHDGVAVLVVEGTIVNLTRHTLEVPRLRLALRNSMGHEVYAWTARPAKTTLGSGNGLPFRARLASPPPDGRDVIVRFLNKRDVGGS